jgi:hypothetical protein
MLQRLAFAKAALTVSAMPRLGLKSFKLTRLQGLSSNILRKFNQSGTLSSSAANGAVAEISE